MTGQPTPPENVRLILINGDEIPVECVYNGLVDGLHNWTAIRPQEIPVDLLREIRIDVLPARTAIGVGVRSRP